MYGLWLAVEQDSCVSDFGGLTSISFGWCSRNSAEDLQEFQLLLGTRVY